ncbi:MAG: hypothetical protein JWN98_75, partial [Abditibacteriota bacterium]|nr:hypothetical protein [Abditibacteriota bacterium]
AQGLPDPLLAMPYALAMCGSTLFAGLANGEIWLSLNQGEQWHPLRLNGPWLEGIRALTIVAEEGDATSGA